MIKKLVILFVVLSLISISSSLIASNNIERHSTITSHTPDPLHINHKVILSQEGGNADNNIPRRDEEFIVYEYGFEDGWNEWISGEPWELSDEDAHNGDFSAHCPVEEDLFVGLITPPMEIPEEDWYTYFEFWVHADMRVYDPDGDNFLDDYFLLHISVDEGPWQDLLYDYGRDDNWWFDWIHYVPGTWWRDDLPRWRMMHNLSQFAGQTVQLRWIMITDDVMDGNQGTGLWIDDFQLIAISGFENDVGVEWMHVGYPVTMETDANGCLMIKNYGFADQNHVRQFCRIDNGRTIPIVPWRDLMADSSNVSQFMGRAIGSSLPYPGNARFSAFTLIQEDDNPANDTASTEILIYPEGMWMLGYDDRRWSEGLDFAAGSGPAVLFTPAADAVEGRFDLYAIEARWSSEEQNEEVATTFTIFSDNNERPGNELHSAEVIVSPDDLDPHVHYIDLADVEDLKNLNCNFWVCFTIEHDDHLPQILGQRMEDRFNLWAEDHYYTYDGENIRASDFDFQIHAILTAAGMDDRGLEARPDLLFGEVAIDNEKTLTLITFGAGTQPVTIEDAEIDGDDAFSVELDGEFPVELGIGEVAQFYVTFAPDDENEYEAELIFECNDDTPPSVDLRGIGAFLPAIMLEPEELDFGEVEIDDFEEQMFNVFNVGLADLIISDIDIAGRYFRIEFEEEVVIEPDQDFDFLVTFTPLVTGHFESELRIISNDPNENAGRLPLLGTGTGGPEVRSPIPDLELEEDFEHLEIADLDTVFVEPDEDEFTFTVESSNEDLMVELDDDNVLMLSATPNWSGEAEVTVIADNDNNNRASMAYALQNHSPRRDLTTELPFHVTVNPVNDLPTSFSLLSPEDGENRIDEDLIFFEWEESRDEIEDSAVTFIIALTYIDSTIRISVGIGETLAPLTREDMVFRSDVPIEIEWMVYAFDGIDSLASNETFQLWISPLAVDEDGLEPLPTELKLGSVYPNPFNDVVEISYDIPEPAYVMLSIIDLSGRLVKVIAYKPMKPGRYSTYWNGMNESGLKVSSGLYICRLSTPYGVKLSRVVLLR